jgi:hypothetical protein
LKKSNVHAGQYSAKNWFQVKIPSNLDFSKKIFNYFNIKNSELFVFYYLESAAKIHPHRDLTGASLNNRIRFHIPVITNNNVNFVVDGEPIKMAPGYLWCLDTSYIHSVENGGDTSRVHIVIECEISKEIKNKMPKGWVVIFHNLKFILSLIASLVRSILMNLIKDPKYLLSQLKMILRFIGWRFFKIGAPK